MRALVVDDSRVVRLAVGRILASLGYSVSEAPNGQLALAMLNDSAPFDVAMVDWNMPVMDGLTLLLAIQAGGAPPPRHIVMVTTENDPIQIQRALDAGASEYVMKPFTREVIQDKLALLRMGGS